MSGVGVSKTMPEAEAFDPPWRDGFGPIPKTEAGIKAAIGGRAHMEWDYGERTTIGRDPRTLSVAEFEALGHRKEPLLKLIRRNCIDCAGNNEAEVRRCALVACPFWPYRMNTNPFAVPQSEERRAAAGERLRRLRAKQGEFAPDTNSASSFAAAKASGGSEMPAGADAPLGPVAGERESA